MWHNGRQSGARWMPWLSSSLCISLLPPRGLRSLLDRNLR